MVVIGLNSLPSPAFEAFGNGAKFGPVCKIRAMPVPLTAEVPRRVAGLNLKELDRISEAAKPSDPTARLSIEDTQVMQITRMVAGKKGKWVRLGRS